MKRLFGLITSSGAIDTYILTAGNLADSVIAFLFTIISFQLLTSSDFGLFSAFNNLIFSTSMILDFGLSQALLFYLPHQKNHDQNATVGSAIALRMLISSVIAFLLFISAHFLSSHFFPGSTPQLIYISALAIIFSSLIDTVIYSLQGLHRFVASVIVSNSFSICRLLIILIFLKFALPYTAFHALSITVLGPIIGIFYGLYLLKPYLLTLSLAKKLLSFGGFMGLYRICQIIALRSDVQIVLTTLGASLAGTYSVAARMSNFYPLIIITLNSLFSSRLRVSNHIYSNFLKKSLLLIFAILFFMLLLAWQAPLIIKLLFGVKAIGAGLIYRYLTLAYLPLMAATLPIAILVFYHANTKFMGLLGLLQVLTMLTVSSLAISHFAQFGPILGLSIANSLVFILSAIKVIKYYAR